MARYIPLEKWTVEKIYDEVERSFARWNYINENGCNDPCWPDGANMNLIRNHIIHFYRLLDQKENIPVQVSLLGDTVSLVNRKPLPPEVSEDYMAKPDELRQGALKTYKALQADENYQAVMSMGSVISDAVKKKVSYFYIANYGPVIKALIEANNLPRLRAYQNTDNWLKSFADYRTLIADEMALEAAGKLVEAADEDESEDE